MVVITCVINLRRPQYRVEDEKDNGGIEPLGGDGNESTELEQVLQTNFSNVLNARPLSSAQMRKRNKKNVRDALFHVSGGIF